MALAKPIPAISREASLNRGLPRQAAMGWLKAGWEDFRSVNLEASLFFGIAVMVVSMVTIIGLILLRADYALFPALAAFMVIGPALAIGLYEKSRRIASGEPVTIGKLLYVRARSRGQIWYIGVILMLLILLWIRAAVLLYALFFGMQAAPPGLNSVFAELFTTSEGLGLLFVGSLFGALFAAFGFAISALSIPMLLNERTDAFSAMGASMALVSNNLPVMLSWGGIVLALFVVSVLTGLLGLVVIFPVLGHATWHAYVAIRGEPDSPIFTPAIPESTGS